MDRVLIVTDDPTTSDRWSAWMELEGLTPIVCAGPGGDLDCPRLHGQQCVRREMADVAVVDLDCDDDADLCARVPDDDTSVFVRRSDPSATDRATLLQAVRGARRVGTAH